MRHMAWRVGVVVLAVMARGAWAEDAFYRVFLTELRIVEGKLPEMDGSYPRWTDMYGPMRPRVVLDGAGEGYVSKGVDQEANCIVVRAEAGHEVRGRLLVATPGRERMMALRFVIPASAATGAGRRQFYAGKMEHYDDLQAQGGPGGAWFRRQADDARAQIPPDFQGSERRFGVGATRRAFSETYDLFVGGRALSENLQLERELPGAARDEGTEEKSVPVAGLAGITVAEMDWGSAGEQKTAGMDGLAGAIPADQHAVFFPSFEALMVLADETNGKGLPVFRGMSGESDDAGVTERYERQLCLQPGAMSRLLGPAMVKSVAITGSDPYYPTGTDVAIVFETADAKLLGELMAAQVRMHAALTPGMKAEVVEIGGVRCEHFATPGREVSSYVGTVGRHVVVSNSPVQIRRLADVHDGKTASIASLGEYRFFRTRYPLGNAEQKAFLLVSDAAIRRWCSAEYRIGASRRVRAGAILADVTAAHLDELVAGVKQVAPTSADTPMRTIGELTMGPRGVRSSVYGSMTFLTPIAELGITEVGADEAAAYERWRETYQQNWSWAFDPIAISFGISRERVTADMTVMPLIAGSEYRGLIEMGRGASIEAGAGDPHDAIAHAVAAINPRSESVQRAGGMARSMAPGVDMEPLGWLGSSVALYADPDPFWGELAGAKSPGMFLEKNIARLPVALRAEVGSAMKLTAFLAAGRAYVDQSAPGMISWETREHAGKAYVKAGLTSKSRGQGAAGGFDDIQVFYAASPEALVVTLNEGVLTRALDRQLASDAEAGRDVKRPAGDENAGEKARPWLGKSMCLQFTRPGVALLAGGTSYRSAMQTASWSNIPILNEWKRRYPGQDPSRVHEAWWGTRLVDPAGGTYVWNEQLQTMESTTMGCPAGPKEGPGGLNPLEEFSGGNFGLDFEEAGLRARAVLERAPVKR